VSGKVNRKRVRPGQVWVQHSPLDELLHSTPTAGVQLFPSSLTTSAQEILLYYFLARTTTNSRVVKQVGKISWHGILCKSFLPFAPGWFKGWIWQLFRKAESWKWVEPAAMVGSSHRLQIFLPAGNWLSSSNTSGN
jgi:hypothetical protein